MKQAPAHDDERGYIIVDRVSAGMHVVGPTGVARRVADFKEKSFNTKLWNG